MAQPANVKFFKGEDEQWYFHVEAENGEVLVRSTDGYERLVGAINGYTATQRILAQHPEVQIVE